jgi:spatacsin
MAKISEGDLVSFVVTAAKKPPISDAYPTLQASFPDRSPEKLFKTIIDQQAWVLAYTEKLPEAIQLIEQIGESPIDHFREWWRQTTRNRFRAILYDFLHKHSALSSKDEANHQILLKITTMYPNTSFPVALKQNASPAMKAFTETAKSPAFKSLIDLEADFKETNAFEFPHLFRVKDEPGVDSPRYFVGSIALIESQSPKIIKLLTGEGSTVERLWVYHCQHRVPEMVNVFKEELDKAKKESRKGLKCLKFMNRFLDQLSTYEAETLLNLLCQSGYFVTKELEDFDALLLRICRNKALFDEGWWSKTTLPLPTFFKQFAVYCAKRNLFMPFELFVITFPKTKEVDLSDVHEPFIKFIWDLWVKRDPGSASLSCLQLIAKSESTDPVELWKALPGDSLAPLASFVWNRDPARFRPGSPETEALSARLQPQYPLLASLVNGQIPHPPTTPVEEPPSRWRSPIFTSKCDLELHDLIASHFDYDFSKVFTDYYGRTPGQPPFPHFDHPELITAPVDPPYVHYVKSMLPLSGFQQAVEDGCGETQFRDLCIQCAREAFSDKSIRLAVLTFIELCDLKFSWDFAVDYRVLVAVSDRLEGDCADELTRLFQDRAPAVAKAVQRRLNPTDVDSFLPAALFDIRFKLPVDYAPITAFARRGRAGELLLFLDRAEEIGAVYAPDDIASIIEMEMPVGPLKDHLLFHISHKLPPAALRPTSDNDHPALIVYRALRSREKPPHVALLLEAVDRRNRLFSTLAYSVPGADPVLCAVVTILTLTDAFSVNVASPPPRIQLISNFWEIEESLLKSGQGELLVASLRPFGEDALGCALARWFVAVEKFMFKTAEDALAKVLGLTNGRTDPLFGDVDIQEVLQVWFRLQDVLAKKCAARSQIHLFRFLQLQRDAPTSELLKTLVALAKAIENFKDFRRAVARCDLLGSPEKIVSDLVANHSFEMGRTAASCLGVSSATVTAEWLRCQYSSAKTPSQVLEVHRSSGTAGDPHFFIALFASLLPYAQPQALLPILRSCKFEAGDALENKVKAIDLHIEICNKNRIEAKQATGDAPALPAILGVLLPGADFSNFPTSVPLSLTAPVLFPLPSLEEFFDGSVEVSIDRCLDAMRVSDAKLLSDWRRRSPEKILLLEALQGVITGEKVSPNQAALLEKFGSLKNLDALVSSVTEANGRRFQQIRLLYLAAKLLGVPRKRTLELGLAEILRSPLPLAKANWALIRGLTDIGATTEAPGSLVESFVDFVRGLRPAGDGGFTSDDYGPEFVQFATLCGNAVAFGKRLLARAKELQTSVSVPVFVNLVLHASVVSLALGECAAALNNCIEDAQRDRNVMVAVVSFFPDAALIPGYVKYFIGNTALSELPQEALPSSLGRIIMNCARQMPGFEPSAFLTFTVAHKLYRDHAELQLLCGYRRLEGSPEKSALKSATQHYLLALSYFLHEKCYSLSMECLRKLSLISLQINLMDAGASISVLHLQPSEVLTFMRERDFPFAITVATAYDLDTEENWADAIFEQTIKNGREPFLQAFEMFKPISSRLTGLLVSKFQQHTPPDPSVTEQMKLFLRHIPNLAERYKIAKQLDFTEQVELQRERDPVLCEWCEKVLT